MASPVKFNFKQSDKNKENTIVFLHGFMGNLNDWDRAVSNLSDSYNCLTIDLPGHGETEVYDDEYFKMQNCAEALINFLDELKIKKTNLLGYSMGGRLGYYLIINYPHRFNKVILESSSLGMKTDLERRERMIADHQLAAEIESCTTKGKFNKFLSKWYSMDFFSTIKANDQLFREIIKKRENNNVRKLALSLRLMGAGAQPSLWNEIGNIEIPALLIAGEKDEKYTKLSNEIVTLNNKFSLEIFNNCGHNVHLEQPDNFLKLVNLFFK